LNHVIWGDWHRIRQIDGKRVMIAQRLERPKRSKKWDLYRLEPENGELVFPSRH